MSSIPKISPKQPVRPPRRVWTSPLLQRKPSEEKDRKRETYLKKVRQVGEDKKWESRRDRILKEDYISRWKQWEMDRALSAPKAPPAYDYDDMEEVSQPGNAGADLVDQIMSQEDQDFNALVSLAQEQPDTDNRPWQSSTSEYGSDEEEYERLFAEYMSTSEVSKGHKGRDPETRSTQNEMDTSLG